MSAKKIDAGQTWESTRAKLAMRHESYGWWALLLFLSIGIGLEALHAFKVDAYLNVAQETRRLVLRLGHAHGTLFALINIVYAASLRSRSAAGSHPLASKLLIAASIMLPSGFLLGGVVVYGGDPGPGIALVPLGALALLSSVFLIAKSPRA